jgi:SpoVK/Ycf46/Vps4 family AAA+-type ATPase
MPITRRSPKQPKFTLVFNIEDPIEETEEKPLPSPTIVKIKPTLPKKRGRRKTVLPTYQGSLDSISDLLRIATEEILYSNINVPLLVAIKQELCQLHTLIGVEEIKKSIFEQLVFYMQHLHEGSEMYLNTVIYGPPGTGKTTIAKIIGSMFSKLNVIKNTIDGEENIFEIARRDDLIGEYLGHTSIKTQEFLEMCLGGVVFIDEVYSLGNKDGNDSFSKEAIDTITLFLSEHRNHMMMIIAGYKEEIETCFFKYNEGLKRRFMWYHTIQPYTPEQLRDIFLLQVTQSQWTYDEHVGETVLQMIRAHGELFKDNAGSIENMITLVKIKHGKRVFLLPENEKKRITSEDIITSIHELQKDKKPEPFLSMYM